VHQARFVPKNFAGAVSVVGYFVAISAFVVLIKNDFGWFWPLFALVGGVAATWAASVVNQKNFEAKAKSAGFDTAEIRAIEDEAERLNDEEYP
jgi:peptidoglycan/LPS O-acetylase OafA/YrhL